VQRTLPAIPSRSYLTENFPNAGAIELQTDPQRGSSRRLTRRGRLTRDRHREHHAIRSNPIDADLTIRGSYSKSFTASTLFAESGPSDTRIVGSSVIQTVFGLANPGFNGDDGNNPNFKRRKTQTRTLSVIYTPKQVPGLTLVTEFSTINQRGFPGGIGFTNILQNVDQLGSTSPFAGNIAMGNFPGLPGAVPFTTPGQLGNYLRANPNNATNVYAVDRFMSLGGVKVRIYTINGSYELPTDTYLQLRYYSRSRC
jgi:iron complex outermembrane recepter protein